MQDAGPAHAIRKRALFRNDFRAFTDAAAESGDTRFDILWDARFPRLDDRTANTHFDSHYLYHTSWAARLLAANKPVEHHDFASDIRFATLVSAFVDVTFYDYRPLLVTLKGLTTRKADLTNIDEPSESIPSLSCMHVVEHIGLGRYGDPIDPRGDLKAVAELRRILAPGGDLYFVVPVGVPSLKFNAHRIYSYEMIASCFEDYILRDFSIVRDDGTFVPGADPAIVSSQSYACGCFWFSKRGERRARTATWK